MKSVSSNYEIEGTRNKQINNDLQVAHPHSGSSST